MELYCDEENCSDTKEILKMSQTTQKEIYVNNGSDGLENLLSMNLRFIKSMRMTI